MKTISVLIIDDDNSASITLKKHLEENHFKVIAIAQNIKEAIAIYYTEDIDIVIIDVFLDGKTDGITFANTINKNKSTLKPFIFLTGLIERDVFEKVKIERPFSFLLKPFNKVEILYTIELVLEKSIENTEWFNGKNDTIDNAFFIKKNNIFHKVQIQDIICIEVEGRYSKIKVDKNSFLLEYSLIDLQKRLPRSLFIRSHRNYIVNINKVKEVHYNDNLIILENSIKALLGRRYKKDFIHRHSILK